METKSADLSSLKIDRTNHSKPPNKKLINLILTTAAIIIAVTALVYFWQSLFNPPVEVKLAAAVMQIPSQSSAMLNANGYVVAQRKAAVASKGTGRLVYLGVVEGDHVKKEQVIARLEDSDIRAQLQEAKASLKLYQADIKESENNFNRQKELLKSGSVPAMAVDAVEANYLRVRALVEVAEARINAAEVALENTLVRAPFDGTVLTKNADVGEIVAPFGASVNSKSAVVTIADMNSLQVEADVSESNIYKIKPEQECRIILDAYQDKSYPGYVAKIVPTADRTKATVLVKVGFKEYDSRVLPEMSAKVSFLMGEDSQITDDKPVLVVPFKAIKERDGKKFVYIVRNETAVEIPVETGRDFGAGIEIISGLANGDKVIERASEEISDGVKVKQI